MSMKEKSSFSATNNRGGASAKQRTRRTLNKDKGGKKRQSPTL